MKSKPSSTNVAPVQQATVLYAAGLGVKQPDALIPKVYRVLTIDELLSLDFVPLFDCNDFSWSPMKALKARDNVNFERAEEPEALHTNLTKPEYHSIATRILLDSPLFDSLRPDGLITVYLAAKSESGYDFGAILPGAVVSHVISHALSLANVKLTKDSTLLSTNVYPDELVTYGNPHNFIYVPRTLKLGFERYLADVEREQEFELFKMRSRFDRYLDDIKRQQEAERARMRKGLPR